MLKYLCLKDWDLKGKVYFKKDHYYKGRKIKAMMDQEINNVKMIGENNMRVKFESVDEYFKSVN
jgi:hypothetical protein